MPKKNIYTVFKDKEAMKPRPKGSPKMNIYTVTGMNPNTSNKGCGKGHCPNTSNKK